MLSFLITAGFWALSLPSVAVGFDSKLNQPPIPIQYIYK